MKGVSRQVIVVHSHDKKLFDQAIFILTDEAVRSKAVTDELLLREAKRLLKTPSGKVKPRKWISGFLYAAIGAMLTGGIWMLTAIL